MGTSRSAQLALFGNLAHLALLDEKTDPMKNVSRVQSVAGVDTVSIRDRERKYSDQVSTRETLKSTGVERSAGRGVHVTIAVRLGITELADADHLDDRLHRSANTPEARKILHRVRGGHNAVGRFRHLGAI
jgi:hypothetical protein